MSAHYSKFMLNTYDATPYFRAQLPPGYPLGLILQRCRAFRRLPPNLRALAAAAKAWAGESDHPTSTSDINQWYDASGYELDSATGRRLTDAEIDDEWRSMGYADGEPDVQVRDIPRPAGGFPDPARWQPPPPPPYAPDPEDIPTEAQLLSDIASRGAQATAREYGAQLPREPADYAAAQAQFAGRSRAVLTSPHLMRNTDDYLFLKAALQGGGGIYDDLGGRAREIFDSTELLDLLLSPSKVAANAFCPTGKGGGRINTCSPRDSSPGPEDVPVSTDKNGFITYAGIHENEWQDWAYDSENINDALRGENIAGRLALADGSEITPAVAKEMRTVGEKIQEAASKYHTSQELLYRGTSFENHADFVSKVSVGQRLEARGLVSTTPSLSTATDYAHSNLNPGESGKLPVILEYRSSSGHQGVYTAPLAAVTRDRPTEGEFVMPRGSAYYVSKIKMGTDGLTHVVMTPEPPRAAVSTRPAKTDSPARTGSPAEAGALPKAAQAAILSASLQHGRDKPGKIARSVYQSHRISVSEDAVKQFLAINENPRGCNQHTGPHCAAGEGAPADAALTPAHTKLIAALRAALGRSKSMTPARAALHHASLEQVIGRMPEEAVGRIMANVKGVRFYGDAASLKADMVREGLMTAEQAKVFSPHGGWNPADQTLILDGHEDQGNPQLVIPGVVAHELTHAVAHGTNLDKSDRWHQMWFEELRDPIRRGEAGLGTYAACHPAEGFAEFGRALYAAHASHADLEQRFPKCSAYWKEQGLWKST